MFEFIASFINSILGALQGIARLGKVASNPIGSIFGTEDSAQETAPAPQDTAPVPEDKPKSQLVSPGKRAWITIPENITARFASRGSPAWVNQMGPLGKGYHYGTDFGGPNGSAVYAPYDMRIVKIGSYTDEGRRGDYIIGTLGDGTEYYTGHLSNVKVAVGDYVKSGTRIADIGYYNHTHIQLRVGGVLTDFEEYSK